MSAPRGRAGKASTKPNRRGPRLTDPVAQAEQAAKDELARFVSLVTREVQWSQFLGSGEPGEPEPPSVPVFMDLRTLGMVDAFFGYDDALVCQKLSWAPETVASLRANPFYPIIKQALFDAARRLGGAKTIDQVAEVLEGAVGRQMASVALLDGGDAKIRGKMLESFADRRSAKISRGVDGAGGIVFPERLLELMEAGLAMEHHLLKKAAPPALPDGGPVIDLEVLDDAIGGDVLNVPRHEEED